MCAFTNALKNSTSSVDKWKTYLIFSEKINKVFKISITIIMYSKYQVSVALMYSLICLFKHIHTADFGQTTHTYNSWFSDFKLSILNIKCTHSVYFQKKASELIDWQEGENKHETYKRCNVHYHTPRKPAKQ